jgi:CRISPR-associated protein Cas1
MKDRYLFKSGRLMRKDHTVLFVSSDGIKKSLPIERIESLHVFGEVDFNTSFINLMGQRNVFIHVYNYYDYYVGSFVPRKKQVSGYVDVQQSKHYIDHDKRMYLARCFVDAAVHHMIRNLRRKEVDEELIEQIKNERENIQQTEQIDQLMGIEGRIRRRYYQGINQIIKYPDFHISKRIKRPPKDPINALISFGNSLMYTTVLKEMYKTSLNPTISFLHQPSTQRFSLSLDLAEIFKPFIIDPLIFSIINTRKLKKSHFDQWENYCYLNEEGKQIFIREYEKKLNSTFTHRTLKRKTAYHEIMRLECYKLVKHMIDDETYKPFKVWW